MPRPPLPLCPPWPPHRLLAGFALKGAYSSRFCKRGSLNVRFAPKATELLRHRELSRRAMYGRRPRCKRNLTYLRIVRVQPCMRPVFRVEACPVAMQPLWLLALM